MAKMTTDAFVYAAPNATRIDSTSLFGSETASLLVCIVGSTAGLMVVYRWCRGSECVGWWVCWMYGEAHPSSATYNQRVRSCCAKCHAH